MRARFQSYVNSGSAGPLACLFERHHLGMLYAGPGVIAAAYDFAIRHNHRTDGGIRADASDAEGCELKDFVEIAGHILAPDGNARRASPPPTNQNQSIKQ